MKNTIFTLLAFVFSLGVYAQGGPKVDAIKFQGKVTTVIRDAFDVPLNETWLLYNVTTGKLEWANSDDVWKDVDTIDPNTDNQTAAQVPVTPVGSIGATDAQAAFAEIDAEFIKNGTNTLPVGFIFRIEESTNIFTNLTVSGAGNTISLDAGDNIENTSVVVRGTGIELTAQENSKIIATGIYAAITKQYGDAFYLQNAAGVAFTPNGSIAATNVQLAIQEVRDEAGTSAASITYITDNTDGIVPTTHATTTAGKKIIVNDSPNTVEHEIDGTYNVAQAIYFEARHATGKIRIKPGGNRVLKGSYIDSGGTELYYSIAAADNQGVEATREHLVLVEPRGDTLRIKGIDALYATLVNLYPESDVLVGTSSLGEWVNDDGTTVGVTVVTDPITASGDVLRYASVLGTFKFVKNPFPLANGTYNVSMDVYIDAVDNGQQFQVWELSGPSTYVESQTFAYSSSPFGQWATCTFTIIIDQGWGMDIRPHSNWGSGSEIMYLKNLVITQ